VKGGCNIPMRSQGEEEGVSANNTTSSQRDVCGEIIFCLENWGGGGDVTKGKVT
jgi:hypothetical protein